MSVPRKKKTTPPFDVTGIDFSVIATSLETGGKMIEQIINGVQYGSPEVRLLMLEECEIIIECRVCRALFRGLPNFIAHKRVYCTQPYSVHLHDLAFKNATAAVPSLDQPVVVEPTAPDDRGKTAQKKNKPVPGLSSGSAQSKAATRSNSAQGKLVTRSTNGKKSGQQETENQNETVRSKTRSRHRSGDKAVESLRETVQQIESGQLGKSQEYSVLTAAAAKIETENAVFAQIQPITVKPMANTANALAVFRGKVDSDDADSPAESGRSSPSVVSEQAGDKETPSQAESTMAAGSKTVAVVGKPARVTDTATVSSVVAKSLGPLKASARAMSKVLRELREKKKEHVAKEEDLSKVQSKKTASRTSPVSSKTQLKPPGTSAEAPIIVDSPSLKEGLKHPAGVALRSSKGDDQPAVNKDKDGNLRAVVKRCLTGRPGSVRVSPLKPNSGDWSDVDSVSETGSHGDKVDAEGDESLVDFENLLCKLCNMSFAGRKSLMYHCQSRHSGQRTIFPCPYCPRVYYFFWCLTRHLNRNHKKTRKDIDRMRKTLRLKAYTQEVIEENLSGAQSTSRLTNKDANEAGPRKSRPSVAARKLVAVSKSILPSDVKKMPAPVVKMPTRRRRVEVIASTNASKLKRMNHDVYRKVYSSKRSQSDVDKPVRDTRTSPTAPLTDRKCTTRKLVAKALLTTRSKRVYNRSNIETDIDLNVLELVNKSKSSRNSRKQVESESLAAKGEGKDELENGNAMEVDESADVGHSAVTRSTESKSDSVHSSSVLLSAKEIVQPRLMVVMSNVQVEQSQTRTKAATGGSSCVTSSPSVSSQNSAKTFSSLVPCVPAEETPGEEDGETVTPEESGSSHGTSSNQLHICIHCQRIFGRKISLDSHIKVCPKAKVGLASSQTAADRSGQSEQGQGSQDIGADSAKSKSAMLSGSAGHGQQGKEETGVETRASTSKSGSKLHDSHASSVRTCSRIRRDGSVDRSELKNKTASSTQDSKLSPGARPGEKGSAGNDGMRAVTARGSQKLPVGINVQRRSNTETSQPSESAKTVRRPSTFRVTTVRNADKHCNENLADDIKSKQSETKLSRLLREPNVCTLQKDSEPSQISSVDGPAKDSSAEQGNDDESLLTVSRQRLLHKLLVATGSKEKEPVPGEQLAGNEHDAVTVSSNVGAPSSKSAARSSSPSKSKSLLPKTASHKHSPQKSVTPSMLLKSVKGRLDGSRVQVAGSSSPANPGPHQKRESSVSSRQLSKNSAQVDRKTVVDVQSVGENEEKAGEKEQGLTGGKDETIPPTLYPENTGEPKAQSSLVKCPSAQKGQSACARELEAPKLMMECTPGEMLGVAVKTKRKADEEKEDNEVPQRLRSTTIKGPDDAQIQSVTGSEIEHSQNGELTAAKESTALQKTKSLMEWKPKEGQSEQLSEVKSEDLHKTEDETDKKAEVVEEKVKQQQGAADRLSPHLGETDPAEDGASSQFKVEDQAGEVEGTVHQRRPQQFTSNLSERPKRKRRAPARVLDSEVTFPKSISRKKARIDPASHRDDASSDCLTDSSLMECGETSSTPEWKKGEGSGEVADGMEQDSDTEETSAGRRSDIVKTERAKNNRIYVVEPSQPSRITCQDQRKVEQIVDEGRLVCLQCKQHFTRLSSLRRHAIRHLGWKRYKCQLCWFCSYDRSECAYHIMRSHPGRVRVGNGPGRVESFITDLNRQAASVRSLKKQQTLVRRRTEGDGEGSDKGSASDQSYVEEIIVYPVPGSSSTPESGTAITVHRPASIVEQMGTPSADSTMTTTTQPKLSSTSAFNISTRNSPRNFDTRPYARPDEQGVVPVLPQQPPQSSQKPPPPASKLMQVAALNLDQEKPEAVKGSLTEPENIDVSEDTSTTTTTSTTATPKQYAQASPQPGSDKTPTVKPDLDTIVQRVAVVSTGHDPITDMPGTSPKGAHRTIKIMVPTTNSNMKVVSADGKDSLPAEQGENSDSMEEAELNLLDNLVSVEKNVDA